MGVRVLLGGLVVCLCVILASSESYVNVDYVESEASAAATSQGTGSTSEATSRSSSRSKPCPKSRCPQNEEYSYCLQSLGRPQYCSEKGRPYIRDNSNGPCQKGCACKINYLRADNGTCIPEEQCQITCGVNERLENCPVDCDPDFCPLTEADETTCFRPEDGSCPPPECKCIFNYKRALNGSCIPTEECPPFDCTGRPNEEYNPCPPLCPTDDCSQATPTGECPEQFGRIGIVLPCYPSCRCIQGYWRLNGICVPFGQCPGICPPNERYSECIQNECVNLNCTQKYKPLYCPGVTREDCLKGCICEENYLRNQNGECVPEDQCEEITECSDPNEELVDCPIGICRNFECKTKDINLPCPAIAGPCGKGCVCKYGYLYDENGVCVPEDECKLNECSDPNEILVDCPIALCRNFECKNRNYPVACPAVVPPCPEGCICKDGYLYDDNGVCIPEDECIPNPCQPNEVWSQCTQAECFPKYCFEREQSTGCPLIKEGDCTPGCVCQDNYLRDDSGNCVPEDQCPITECSDPNEILVDCPIAVCRNLECKNRNYPVACPAIAPPCPKGCICKDGYLYDDNGVCTPEDECLPNPCSYNEVYSNCTQTVCRPQDCSDKYDPIVCAPVPEEDCIPGCVCQDDYYRDDSGNCVPEDQCPINKCSDPNEILVDCPIALCRNFECKNRNYPVACPAIVPPCPEGCICKDGYLYDDNGVCIPEDECIPNPCQPNEVWSQCTQAECFPKYCFERGQSTGCPLIKEGDCTPGCVCQDNYLRDDSGNCVPEDQCPITECSDPNEILVDCPIAVCRNLECKNRNYPVACPAIAPPCPKGCICKDGYLYDDNGVCTPEDECLPNPCSYNEVYSNCTQTVCRPQDCSDKYDPIVCAPVPEEDCIPGCVCQDDYYRDDSGNCVPEDQCPINKCSDPNEILVDCPIALCRNFECKNRNYPVACPAIVPPCPEGCICKDGYLYDDNGVCIPEDECIPNPCQPNEVWSQCTQAECFPKYCFERGQSTGCPLIKEGDCTPGCVCQDNYLRDDSGNCVPEDQCPITECSDPNEILVDCPIALCRNLECKNRNYPVACPAIAPPCPKGCICKDGYLYDDNGVCIPEDECLPNPCSYNEVYSNCTQTVCRPQNCSDKYDPIVCAPVPEEDCIPGCVCQDDYYRDDSGNCVSEDQCPITCGANEIFVDCSTSCTSDYCPSSADEEQVCTQSETCTPGCKCAFNYRRAANGTCIPTTSCPPFDCSDHPNEEYDPCPPICPSDECGQPRLKGKCPFKIGIRLQCNPQCRCMDGYGRVNGTCVSFFDCPDLCPSNEEYTDCTQDICRPQTCEDKDNVYDECDTCERESCQRGCVCKPNFYRNDDGNCVPYEECPVCGPNQEYRCVQPCPPQPSCRNRGIQFSCLQWVQPCENKCVCKEGYYLNSIGECVTNEQCDQCSRPNEYYSCGPECDNECATLQTQNKTNCPIVNIQCNKKCYCDDGYARDENKNCIPIDKCPPSCGKNEEYLKCRRNCPPDTCFAITARYDCRNATCEPGCSCKPGYYRPKEGKPCVPLCECPQMRYSPDCAYTID